ncbi:hypothetical protein LV78_006278 [Actinosynnema pretiosum]|nr:hypothetical protein [Actinosynnema pretiosum]
MAAPAPTLRSRPRSSPNSRAALYPSRVRPRPPAPVPATARACHPSGQRRAARPPGSTPRGDGRRLVPARHACPAERAASRARPAWTSRRRRPTRPHLAARPAPVGWWTGGLHTGPARRLPPVHPAGCAPWWCRWTRFAGQVLSGAPGVGAPPSPVGVAEAERSGGQALSPGARRAFPRPESRRKHLVRQGIAASGPGAGVTAFPVRSPSCRAGPPRPPPRRPRPGSGPPAPVPAHRHPPCGATASGPPGPRPPPTRPEPRALTRSRSRSRSRA